LGGKLLRGKCFFPPSAAPVDTTHLSLKHKHDATFCVNLASVALSGSMKDMFNENLLSTS